MGLLDGAAQALEFARLAEQATPIALLLVGLIRAHARFVRQSSGIGRAVGRVKVARNSHRKERGSGQSPRHF